MENNDDVLVEPPLYFGQDHIFDLIFHPKTNILACGMITGQVNILSYDSENVIEVGKYEHHKQSCRSIDFSIDGQNLATCSKDKSIAVLDCNGKLISHITKAHKDSVNVVKYLPNNLLASGDDEGTVKLWDLRISSPNVITYEEQAETITDFTYSESSSFLLSTSVDGTLAVYDLKKSNTSKEKLYALSDCLEEDLLSVVIVKDSRFVLCSTNEGRIFVFKWDWFGDCKDRIVGHPNSIDSMIKIDENTVLTGSEDGILRGVSIYPNKIVALLGQHSEDDEHFPIQKISVSHCKNFAASCSHDSSIKFYEIRDFVNKRKNLNKEDIMDLDKINFEDGGGRVKGKEMDLEQDDEDFEDEDSEEEEEKNRKS